LKDEEGQPLKEYTKLIGTQAAVISATLNTAAKIDENQLRRETKGKLDEIMDMIREREIGRDAKVING
jgi:hypothetical protein